MKQDPAYFESCEPALLYIERRLKDALRLEALLTQAGIEYGVEADKYRGGFIFQTERVGAFFYVRPEIEEMARSLLLSRGYRLPPKEATDLTR